MNQRIIAEQHSHTTAPIQAVIYQLLYAQIHPTPNTAKITDQARDLFERKIAAYENVLAQNRALLLKGEHELDNTFQYIQEQFCRELAIRTQYQALPTNIDKAVFRGVLDITNFLIGRKGRLHYDLWILSKRMTELATVSQMVQQTIHIAEEIQDAATLTNITIHEQTNTFIENATQFIDRAFRLHLQLYVHTHKLQYIYQYYYGALPEKYQTPGIDRERLHPRHQYYYDIMRENNRAVFEF